VRSANKVPRARILPPRKPDADDQPEAPEAEADDKPPEP
jgi:hypothetical protein